MSNNKLKNVKAVKEMLQGTHKTQTKKLISVYKEDTISVKRNVGDVWVDENGVSWEQKSGYKVKLGKLAKHREYMNTFPNCPKEVCTCHKPSNADEKMRGYHGMCLDCVIDMEHTMKINGTFDEYQRKKMLDNANVWLKNAETEKELLKYAIRQKYFNEDGSVDEWEGGKSYEDIVKDIDNQFESFKENFIKKLENQKN